jgi:hypothetical protein
MTRKVPHFRGVFMRDTLPKDGPRYIESGIINLDIQSGSGTHWTAYKKVGDKVDYFDPVGDLPPPLEFEKYVRKGGKNIVINYNIERYQPLDSNLCGYKCVEYIKNGYRNN